MIRPTFIGRLQGGEPRQPRARLHSGPRAGARPEASGLSRTVGSLPGASMRVLEVAIAAAAMAVAVLLGLAR